MTLASPLIHALDKADLIGAPDWGPNLRPSWVVCLTTLTVLLRIGVSHKVQTIVGLALTIIPMTCRVMLLSLGVTVLFPFPRSVLL